MKDILVMLMTRLKKLRLLCVFRELFREQVHTSWRAVRRTQWVEEARGDDQAKRM
jgi:hypothetical protein